MRDSLRGLQRWSVVLTGAGLLLLSVATVSASRESAFLQPEAIGVLVAVASGIAGLGVWLVTREEDPESTLRITAWIWGAVLVSGLLVTGGLSVLMDGLGPVTATATVVYFGTIGSTVGAAIGYNDVRRRAVRRRAETAMAAVERSTDAIAVLGTDGTFDLVNEAFVELFGFDSKEAALESTWQSRYEDGELERIEEEVLPALAETGSWEGETTARRADGETVRQELSLTKLENDRRLAVVRDVTEREERRREVDRLALEGTGTGVWEWELDTESVSWNESFERLVGLDPGEFEGTYDAFADRIHPDDVSTVERAIGSAIEGGEMYQAEFRMEREDGSLIWVEARGSVVGEGDDQIMVGIVTDVTDRMERARALDETTERLELALGGASPAIWEWNVETDELVWNESMERTLGYAPGEFEGDFGDFVESVHPEDRETVYGAVEGARESDAVTSTECRVENADGEYRWLDLRGKFVEEDGETRMIGLARDVTERERYRRELAHREREYAALIDNLPGVVYRCLNEKDWPMEFVGGECEAITGYTAEAFESGERAWDEIIRKADREHVWQTVQNALESKDSYELTYQIVTADGEERWVHEQGSGIYDESGELEALEGFITDVTERLEYEQELEKRRRAIEILHDSTRAMIDSSDEAAVCAAAVEAAEQALDAPLVGIWLADETHDTLVPTAMSDRSRETFDAVPTYSEEERSLSWDAYVSGEVHVTNDPASEETAANPDTPVCHEIVLPIGDVGVMNIGRTEDRPFDDVDVDVARLLASNLVSAFDRATREAELKRQTDQLEFFNSILRHDVLNGMTVIRSRSEILADQLEGTQGEYAETIVKWSDNVTAVTGRVQRVIESLTAEEGAITLEPVDVSAIVAEHLDRLQTTTSEASFSLDGPESAYVTADELLSDAVGNLLTNAVEHNDEAIEVRTTIDVGTDVVTVEIADDGQGVPDDRKESVFRRGETGHAKETGSGFGLFFVDATITKYGGDVSIRDNDAGGATFVVELPRATSSAGAEPGDPRQADST